MNQFKALRGRYPAQVWVLFWGVLFSQTGNSLVWPFLTIYIRQQLGVPLAQITLLFTLQSLASLVATAVIGPASDRFGRKWLMIVAPLISGANLVLMAQADTLALWGVLLSIFAASNIAFRLAAQAMIADLIPPENRAGAYALLRMAFNVGIAIGPAIGGFLITIAYAVSFYIAAIGQVILVVVVIFVIRETLPEEPPESTGAPPQRGYGPLLRDRAFLSLWSVYLLVELGSSIVFTLLAVYIKEQFGIPESQYGFILGTNAAMVVLFQYAVTRGIEHRSPMHMLALGGVFYAVAMGVYAVGVSFAAFWLGMVIMTVGELIISPTATTLVANLAPADMRGRYMGVYGLSWRIGSGVGPPLGGVLNDNIAPAATWIFAMLTSLVASGGFLLMTRSRHFEHTAPRENVRAA